MTSTVLVEQKKRRKKNAQQTSIGEIFQWAMKELYKTAQLFQKRKKQVILETARRLEEAGIEPNNISTEIAKGLKAFVDHSWVNKVLNDYPQYKDESQSKRRKSGRINPTRQAQMDRSLPQKQLVQTQQEQGRPGITNQAPDEYDINKLDEYDIEYLKCALRWNHEAREGYIKEAFKWQTKFDEMKAEQKKWKNTELDKVQSTLEKVEKQIYGKWDITPEEYQPQKLDEYGKDLLIKIVKMLHNQKEHLMTTYTKWDAQVESLRRENKVLKEEVAELKKKLGQSIT